MPNALVFRPDYEVLTRYVSRYIEAYVIGSAKELGFTVTDLYKERANSSNFLNSIYNQDVVIFGTHGLDDTLFGQNGEIVLFSCLNDDALSGKICFALACRTATKLGHTAVDKGCRCYFGWLQDFVVIIDESYKDPLQDPYAGSFLRPVINGMNIMMTSFIYGKEIKEIAEDVYSTVIDSFNAEIQHWREVDSTTASQMLTYLYWDRDHFIPIFKEEVYVPTPVYVGTTIKGLFAVAAILIPLMVTKKPHF